MRLYYGWYVVAATFTALGFAFGLSYYNNPVFYPTYIDEFHWSRIVVASGGSLNLFVLGILSPLIGMLADRFSVKRIILAGIICDALSKISFSFMNGLTHYYLSNVLVGVGLACTSLVTIKLLIAKWFERKEGLALGIVISGYAIGGSVGPVLTSYLLPQYGWREVHLMFSVLLWGIIIPIFWFVAKEKPQEMGLLPDGAAVLHGATPEGHEGSGPEDVDARRDLTFRQALTTPTLWFLCLAILLFHVCIISIREHFVLHLTDLGFKLGSASAGLSVLLLASILARFAFGALSDQYSKKILIIMAYLMLSVMCFALFLITTSWVPPFARNATTIYTVAALIGIGYGGGIICIPIVSGECFGQSSLGKILGLIVLFNSIGGMIGPILVGYLFDISGGYQLAFFLISMVAFGATGCLAFIKTDLQAACQSIAAQ